MGWMYMFYFLMLFVSGNAVLLAFSAALYHLYENFRKQCSISGFLKPMNYLCVFIAVETTVLAYVIVMYICKLHSINVCTVQRSLHIKKCGILIALCCICCYIGKVIQFNRSKPPPDVQREEWMISFIQDSYSGGEVGYR